MPTTIRRNQIRTIHLISFTVPGCGFRNTTGTKPPPPPPLSDLLVLLGPARVRRACPPRSSHHRGEGGVASHPAGEGRRGDPTARHRLLTEGSSFGGKHRAGPGAGGFPQRRPPRQRPTTTHLTTQLAAQALPITRRDPRRPERGPVQGHEGRQLVLTVSRHGRAPPQAGAQRAGAAPKGEGERAGRRELRARGGALPGAGLRRAEGSWSRWAVARLRAGAGGVRSPLGKTGLRGGFSLLSRCGFCSCFVLLLPLSFNKITAFVAWCWPQDF